MKRLISVIAAAAIMLSLALPVSAEYEDTYINTGDQKADIIAHAMTQLGYTEGKWSSTPYGLWIGENYKDWCSIFVSWCANQAEIPQSIIPKTSSCTFSSYIIRQRGGWHYSRYRGGDYIPQVGDLIYFNWVGNYDTTCSHVGIVVEVTEDSVITIEGNAYYSGAYTTLNWNDGVRNKSYSLDNPTICGYGTPNYEGSEETGSSSRAALKRASSPSGGAEF
jgi:hypothetical protein